jgi:glycosyltransferase involved in cell wall biosynthesis
VKLSLLLLCYNEIGTIELEIHSWNEVLSELPPEFEYEIIVVEDGSTDGTTELLKHLDSESQIFLLHEDKRSGYNSALMRGLKSCDGDFIFFSDTGLKNDFKDFWGIFYRRELADLILGRKVLRQDEVHRKLLTKGLNFYLRRILGSEFNLHDVDSGFRMFNKKFKDHLIMSGFSFKGFAGCEMVLLAWKSKFTMAEVPISYVGRIGESRGIPNSKVLKMTIQLIRDIRNLLAN